MPATHELTQNAFGQQRMGDVEPRELELPRTRGHGEMVEKPLVEWPVVLEFQCGDRMGHVLDGVRLAMGEIVAWIDGPSRAGARMTRMEDAVEHGIAQVDIWRRHVDAG